MATETLRPNAVGDETNITGESAVVDHYTLVDEAETDDDSTYVYENTDTYHRDLYGVENHSVGSGTINNIKV